MTKTINHNVIGMVGLSGPNVHSPADINQELFSVHDLKEEVNFALTRKKRKQNYVLLLINVPLIASLAIGLHGRNALNPVGRD